ncbi:MAG: phenylalanine--tRNA ligase subunit alpha, partial [Thermoplasmata archaeon]
MDLSNNEKLLVKALKELGGSAGIKEIMDRLNLSIVEIMNAASWLKMKGVVKIEEILKTDYKLSDEGEKAIRFGLPEKIMLEKLMKVGVSNIEDLKKELGKDTVSIGIAQLKGNGIEIYDGKISIVDSEKALEIVNKNMENLKNFQTIDNESLRKLIRRGLVEKRDVVERMITLTQIGKSIDEKDLVIKEEITQLTPEHIQTGVWKNKELKRYDIRMFAPLSEMGREHPLTQFIEKVRKIFIGLGFTEIDGDYIVPAFW